MQACYFIPHAPPKQSKKQGKKKPNSLKQLAQRWNGGWRGEAREEIQARSWNSK